MLQLGGAWLASVGRGQRGGDTPSHAVQSPQQSHPAQRTVVRLRRQPHGPGAVIICFAEKETKAGGEGSEAHPRVACGDRDSPCEGSGFGNKPTAHSFSRLTTDVFTKQLLRVGAGIPSACGAHSRHLINAADHNRGTEGPMAVIHQALMIPSVIPVLCFLWEAVRSSGAASG